MRTRFAPSPTGHLHRGHAVAAREAFGFADEHGGTCLLRIEDIDHTRCRTDYTTAIYEDLHWLGFDWPLPVRVQSAHRADYAGVVTELMTRGLAYPCELSRAALKSGQRTPPHPTTDADIEVLSKAPTHLPWAVRLNLDVALKSISKHSLTYSELGDTQCPAGQHDARPPLEQWMKSDRPDPIIARRDIGTSYHIAVTHDDALQHITHVVRGADLIDETPLHVLIQSLMGWPTPQYYHHALRLGPDGKKLSKTAKSETIQTLRAAGLSAKDILTN